MIKTVEALATIDPSDLARVAPFAAASDVRYYLNGVCVEPAEKGAVLVATDGHMLAALHSPNSRTSRTLIMPMDKAFRGKLGKADKIVIEDEKTFPQVIYTGAVRYVHPAKIIDGKFPDWRKVVPAAEDLQEGIPGQYNAKYIKAALDTVVAAIGSDKFTGVRFMHSKTDPDKGPLVVRPTYGTAADLLILVMSMRSEPNLPALPAWLTPPAAQEKAA